jgi:iron complex transport system ATP-binding protein
MRLIIDKLFITQNNHLLIKDFSEKFKSHEICALVGKNGSGKTTLLRTLAGLFKTQGSCFIDGLNINNLNLKQKALLISFLQQIAPAHPYCQVLDRIAQGLMPIYGHNFFLDKEKIIMIEEIALRLRVSHLLKKPLSKLSGGEERLVYLAKCLINPKSTILLLDEPSVFLDFSEQENLISCLKEEAQKGKLIIFSSHDQYLIKNLAQRVLKIENSQIQAQA